VLREQQVRELDWAGGHHERWRKDLEHPKQLYERRLRDDGATLLSGHMLVETHCLERVNEHGFVSTQTSYAPSCQCCCSLSHLKARIVPAGLKKRVRNREQIAGSSRMGHAIIGDVERADVLRMFGHDGIGVGGEMSGRVTCLAVGISKVKKVRRAPSCKPPICATKNLILKGKLCPTPSHALDFIGEFGEIRVREPFQRACATRPAADHLLRTVFALLSTAALKLCVITTSLKYVLAGLAPRDRLSLVVLHLGLNGLVCKSPLLRPVCT
jgi:hypothetical protein